MGYRLHVFPKKPKYEGGAFNHASQEINEFIEDFCPSLDIYGGAEDGGEWLEVLADEFKDMIYRLKTEYENDELPLGIRAHGIDLEYLIEQFEFMYKKADKSDGVMMLQWF